MVRLLGVATLTTVVTAPVQGQQPQQRAPFAVAEVRADGLLLPDAKWDGTRWHDLTMTNPDSIRRMNRLDPPLAPRSEWYYVPFSGTRARLILGDAVQILTNYYDDWGFTTNLVVRRFDSPTDHSVKVGVATSDSVPLRLFTSAAPRETALARAAMRQLLDSLWKAVSDSVRKAGKRPPPPPPAADTFTFGASVVLLSDDTTLMYAHSRLPVSADPDVPTCGIFAGYSGFAILHGERVHFQRGERVLFQNSPVMSDCEGKGLQGEDPDALFDLGGRTFVLATHFYYEDAESVIWEWRDSRLTLVFRR
jgi:hypothetical protein